MARRDASAEVVPLPHRPNTALVGAARRIDLQKRETDAYRRKAQAKEWQADALTYFGTIGIVKQSTYSLANTCSLARLFVAYQPDPEADPIAAPDGMVGVAEARDALDRLASGAKGGHASLIHRSVVQLKVPGECYLVGLEAVPERPATAGALAVPAKPEEWLVASISEVQSKGDDYFLKRTAGREDGRKLRPPDETSGEGGDFLLRIWQEDAEYAEEADSALRGALGECEEYLILSRAVRATGRSRIAGAGILVLPSEADLGPVPELDDNDDEGPSPEEVDDPATAAFAKKLLDAMVTPIAEEGDASAVVPIVVRIPGEHCDKLRHVKFERPADDFGNQRKHVIERLGMQLDIPLEEVIGITGSRGPVFMSGNTISQMDQKLWNRYGRPTMGTLCESLSVGFLRPMVEASGLNPSVAERLMVWYDPASAIADPDPSESADEALDRGTISESAYRGAKGYAEGDAPTPEELQRRHDLGLLGRSSGGPLSGSFPSGASAADDAHVVASTNGHRPHVAITAAARAPLGHRLASIDRSLRLQLSEIVDAAMRRALERAGARVRNKAAKSTPLRASVATTPADKVPAKLGRAVVADALGLTDDELLAGQFDDIGGRFDHRVSQAQAQALAALADDLDLDDAEIASLQRSQDRDRHDAWIWLSGALLALAHERLYSPEPQAPARGEFDASALVPSGIVREAMERAGGGVASAEGPPGGVALGDLVQSLWARHGRVVAGWTWLYGDPGSRTTPFDPHEALDGVEFANWTDPALTNNESWPSTDFFRPGDHAWCQCDFEPIGLDAEPAADTEPAMAGAE